MSNIDQKYFQRQFPTPPYSFVARCRVQAAAGETVSQVSVGIISNGGVPSWSPMNLNQSTGLYETNAALANDSATPFTARFKVSKLTDDITDPMAESP